MTQDVKPSSEILTRIQQNSRNNPDEVFTRLYRYLSREDLYIAAFQKLYSNDGAMTPGINDDTASGFGMEYVRKLIQDLKQGTYRTTPVRRTYVRKKNGKFRPLGIPSFRDKLLQEVVRMILEAIYEPIFDPNSHGFRPKRSCHTALMSVKQHFEGASWVIEGDIASCFDSIDHDILLGILGKKIKDQRFLNVIRQFLRSGYMEDWTYHDTYSGAVQGGVISPILMNIYMNEFDKKLKEIESRLKSQSPAKKNPLTPEYLRISDKIQYRQMRLKTVSNASERMKLIKEITQLKKDRLNVPATQNLVKKIRYIRYADDWVVAVWGSKADCVAIKEELSNFLSSTLKLTLSEEKTLITHSSKKVRFLGYDFSIYRSQITKGIWRNGKRVVKRTLSKHVALSAPLNDKILQFMFSKGAIKQKKDGTIYPVARTKLMNKSDSEIVSIYNSEVRGILNFYSKAGNYYKLGYFRYLMEYSCLATLARKHECSISKIKKMYSSGGTWSVPYETKAGTKRVAFVTLKDCKGHHVKDPDRVKSFLPYYPKELWGRIVKNQCEYCGVPSESDRDCKVFVTRRLKDLGNRPWELLMKDMRRKTLVVCPTCFKLIQSRECVKS